MNEVIHIIENKTVPAFSVALTFAVICAGGDETLKAILKAYACHLGIAYQLLDDLEDFQSETNIQLRPTSVLAAICEDMGLTNGVYVQDDICALINKNKSLPERAKTRISAMVETYRQQAFDSLAPLKNTALKQLLFRITKKVLK